MKNLRRKTAQYFLEHLKNEWPAALLCLLAPVVGVVANNSIMLIMKFMIDIMEKGITESTFSELQPWIIAMVIAYFATWAGWRAATYGACYIQPKIMAKIGQEALEKLNQKSFAFFNDNFVGSLVKKSTRFTRSFENIYDQFIFVYQGMAARIIIAISILSWVNIYLGLVLTLWLLIYMGFNLAVAKYKIKKYDTPMIKVDSKVTGELADAITNNHNIKLFASQAHEERRFKKTLLDWREKNWKAWFFASHIETVQGLLMNGLALFTLVFSIRLWIAGDISLSSFVIVQTFLGDLFMGIWDFGREIRRTFEHFADASEMTEILMTEAMIQDVPNASQLHVHYGSLEFKKLGFTYDEGKAVLKNFNLQIKPGEKVALIGPTGSGKSTLVKLLLRLHELDSGQILVDDQDIAEVTQNSLRKQIALVPQSPILFHRTLMENIRYGNLNASDEEVIAAAKMANCHEFISTMPKGYKTLVGERGVKLSGGERQRIAIARAILKNAPILVLDEATSNLDVQTEELISDALNTLMKQKTTIVVAHRLTTVVNMDRIIVLKNGKILEQGSHAELMNKGGHYKALWDVGQDLID